MADRSVTEREALPASCSTCVIQNECMAHSLSDSTEAVLATSSQDTNEGRNSGNSAFALWLEHAAAALRDIWKDLGLKSCVAWVSLSQSRCGARGFSSECGRETFDF